MSKKNDERLARIEENLSRVLNLLLQASAPTAKVPEQGGRQEKSMAVYKNQVLKLHNQGLPIGEIAEQVGLHRATLRTYMKHYGVTPKRKQARVAPPKPAEYNAKLKQNIIDGGQDA
jgi:AraC-like DNA-binding protein